MAQQVFDRLLERVAGLDVHKAQVTAAIRVPDGEGGRLQDVAEFSTTVRGLMALRDWLEAHQVTDLAMEATGVYWRPVWAILEDRFACILVNARDVKQVPGRKTDVGDAAWIAQLLEAGLLRASLVPPKPIRTLRNLTRYRKTQIEERQREANRLHKILEDTGIKLDCVASNILGTSGRAMLDALVAGTTDPVVLADLAKGRLRAKLPALTEALEGRFDSEHALIVSAILAHLDFLDEQIDRLSDAIGAQLGPFATAVELLCTIPGVQRRTAEVIIAETGGDMTVFPTARHLASWAGACPGNDQSAGKRRSGRTRKGSRWLGIALTEAALASTRTKDTYLAAQYRRLRPRRGHKRALGAVKHSISSPPGTCSAPASCTANRAATTSNDAATPTARSNASSLSSNASDTPSRSRLPPRDQPLLDHEPISHQFSSPASPAARGRVKTVDDRGVVR